jgi:zinc transporter ZupT
VLIAVAFLSDVRLGVVTSLAVAAHEIPQEAGDLVILLHSGQGVEVLDVVAVICARPVRHGPAWRRRVAAGSR